MRPDGPSAGLRDVAGKAAEQAARIAGVLQIIEDLNATVIQPDVMANACELASWYPAEAAKLASEALVPPAIRDAQLLLTWLQRRNTSSVTAADIQKNGPGQLRNKARLDPAIEVLESHRWLIAADVSRRSWTIVKAAT
jgi:Protein of unknown function (DUF3987)